MADVQQSYNRNRIFNNPENDPKTVVLVDPTNPNIKTQLPLDVITSIGGEKLIAESQIVDGVAVFERISRKPLEINFDFTIRSIDDIRVGANKVRKGYVFGQKDLETIFFDVFKKDSVLNVNSTLLNGLDILEVVVFNINIGTIRGNTNIPVTIMCKENYNPSNSQGQTLIQS